MVPNPIHSDEQEIDLNDLFEDFPLGQCDSKYFELNDLLINIDHKNFEYKALHLNIRSLASNFDKLNVIIGDFLSKNCDLDFIFLCETFLTDLNSSLFNIEGFQKVEKHRSCTRGGGVALYINNKHDFSVRNDLSHFEEGIFESIFVELNTGTRNLILGEVYRVPNTNVLYFNETYENILATVMNEKKELLIGSDQNLNLLKANEDKNIQMFLDLNYSQGMLPVIVKPTRITYDTATLIDNFYTSNKDSHKSAILLSDISDHLPIFICFEKSKCLKKSYNKITFTVNKMDEQAVVDINNDLKAIDWNTCLSTCNVDESFSLITSKVNECIGNNSHVKVVQISSKKVIREPWLTKGLLKSSNRLDRLHTKSLRGSSETKEKYKKHRNLFNSIKRKAKQAYYNKIVEEFKNDSSKLWHSLNKIIGKTSNKKDLPNTFMVNGVSCSDPKKIADGFCDYFTSVGETFSSRIPRSNVSYSHYLNKSYNKSIFFDPITEEEVSSIIIKQIKPKKSCGHDGISGWLIKKLHTSLSLPLSIAINKSIESGIVPESQKIAKVIPIYKSKDSQQFGNYRPISLLPILSKVLEKAIYKKIYNFLTCENILYTSQYGFRHGHSTIQATSELLFNILNGFENNKYSLALFLDLSKAFDTIDHSIMLKKLEYYGIRGLPLSWFKSYLSNRKQYVLYHGKKSKVQNVNCGVPQGSVLGPLLFLLYVNDLPNTLNLCKALLFADDTTIFYTHDDIDILYQTVNNELSEANEWFRANKLSINATKTYYLLFHTRYMDVPEHSHAIVLNNTEIQKADFMKFLGLFIDDKLEWQKHTSFIASKLARSMYILNSIKFMVPSSTLKTLYYSLMYSHLNYGIIHWSNTYKYNLTSIINKQTKAVKVISRTKKTVTPSIFSKFHILQLSDVAHLEMTKLIYSFMHDDLPTPLMNMFATNQELHPHGTRQALNPHIESFKHKIVLNSFIHKAPELWTKVPLTIKNCPSKISFSKNMKKYLYSNY